MRVWLALAVLVSAGCTCSDGVCMGTGATPQSEFLTTAGTPVTITVLNPVECGSRRPMSVVVSVLDPQISPTPATASSPLMVGGAGYSTDVTFTPPVAGQYHVVARFEPNFGKFEVDVLVAADRRDAGSVPSNCARGDFTPGGLALCFRAGGADVIGSAQSFSGDVARYEGTVWESNGRVIKRWVEDGGGFTLTQMAQTVRHEAIIPGADDALLVLTGGRVLWWVDGGVRDTTVISPTTNVVWRGGGNVVTVTKGTNPGAVKDLGWCIEALSADAGRRCTNVGDALTIIGASPAGIALDHVLGTGQVEALVFNDRSGAGFRLPTGWRLGPFPNPRWDTVAFMGFDGGGLPDGGPYVLKRTPDGVIVEDYGTEVLNATSTCVTTGTRLIRR